MIQVKIKNRTEMNLRHRNISHRTTRKANGDKSMFTTGK